MNPAAAEAFHGRAPEELDVVLPEPSGDLVELGPLMEIHYLTDRDGEWIRAEHMFRSSCRPILAVDGDGEGYILAGRYSVGEDGIADGGRERPRKWSRLADDAPLWVLGQLLRLEVDAGEDEPLIIEWADDDETERADLVVGPSGELILGAGPDLSTLLEAA